jgi:hypothetical protein
MSRDTTVIRFRQPDAIDDPLSELAREGARRMLAQVLIAEADAFVAMWKDLKLPDGRDRVVRHGHGAAARYPDRGRACRGPSRQAARARLPAERSQVEGHWEGRHERAQRMRGVISTTFTGARKAAERELRRPRPGLARTSLRFSDHDRRSDPVHAGLPQCTCGTAHEKKDQERIPTGGKGGLARKRG